MRGIKYMARHSLITAPFVKSPSPAQLHIVHQLCWMKVGHPHLFVGWSYKKIRFFRFFKIETIEIEWINQILPYECVGTDIALLAVIATLMRYQPCGLQHRFYRLNQPIDSRADWPTVCPCCDRVVWYQPSRLPRQRSISTRIALGLCRLQITTNTTLSQGRWSRWVIVVVGALADGHVGGWELPWDRRWYRPTCFRTRSCYYTCPKWTVPWGSLWLRTTKHDLGPTQHADRRAHASSARCTCRAWAAYGPTVQARA